MRGRGAILLLAALGGLALGPIGAWGQEPQGALTVDDLVARALADNPGLRAMRAEVEAARALVGQAGLRPNPMLEVGGMQSVSGPDNTISVEIVLPLELGGRRGARVGVAEREVEVKRARADDEARRLRAEVRMKAGEWLAAGRTLAFTEDLLAANRRALELVRGRVSRGGAAPLEERLMLVEVNRLEAERRMVVSRVEVLAFEAKALAGLPPEAPLGLRGDLLAAPPAVSRAEAFARVTERADLLAARAEVAAAGARVEQARAEGRWDASIGLGYQRQRSGFDLNGIAEDGSMRMIDDTFHMVGGTLTITLPVRNRNQGTVAASQAEGAAARERLERTSLTAQSEIAAALARYEAARAASELYGSGVRDIARENLAVVRRTHELGRVPLLDVIAEQRRYIEVETGYTQALKEAYDAAVEIERAVGAGQ